MADLEEKFISSMKALYGDGSAVPTPPADFRDVGTTVEVLNPNGQDGSMTPMSQAEQRLEEKPVLHALEHEYGMKNLPLTPRFEDLDGTKAVPTAIQRERR